MARFPVSYCTVCGSVDVESMVNKPCPNCGDSDIYMEAAFEEECIEEDECQNEHHHFSTNTHIMLRSEE